MDGVCLLLHSIRHVIFTGDVHHYLFVMHGTLLSCFHVIYNINMLSKVITMFHCRFMFTV